MTLDQIKPILIAAGIAVGDVEVTEEEIKEYFLDDYHHYLNVRSLVTEQMWQYYEATGHVNAEVKLLNGVKRRLRSNWRYLCRK